jgi:D-cysteine desulfhydrase
MTFGCAGSNHATATAIYARQLGLRSISMLLPQPNAYSVRRNLLMGYLLGAELHHYQNLESLRSGVRYQLNRHAAASAAGRQEAASGMGRGPEMIPVGGSSALGALGYVNAAIELHNQIRAGALPEPDRLYVATGTMGTAAGLVLGLRLMGLKTRVTLVRVTDPRYANAAGILELLHRTAAMLHAQDPSFPALEFAERDIDLRHDFYGEQYGLYTRQSMAAVQLLDDTQGIHIEGTYTGKTCAALIHDAKKGRLKGKVTLFWNTYNSRDFSDRIAGLDYHDLPRAFHRYFEQDVQPLDKGERAKGAKGKRGIAAR